LIKAAQRFDETRGFKFISYAVWWIRQSILQALAEQSRIVRLPLNKIGSINKINKMYALLEQSNERPPSAEEIAKGHDVNDVKESMKTLDVTYQWMRLLLKEKILTFMTFAFR
jgi:RNA polymerase primary sigma factor